MTTSITQFFDAWSMGDDAARTAALAGILDDAACYADPRTAAPITGLTAISDYIGVFAQTAPGATATVAKSDIQHGLTRVTIVFRMPNGMEQLGQYFIEMTDEKITRMTGFVGTGAPE